MGGGCSDADYANFIEESIVLIARAQLKDCSILAKIQNANKHKAKAAVLYYDPGTI